MRPKKHATTREGDLFRARFDQIINMNTSWCSSRAKSTGPGSTVRSRSSTATRDSVNARQRLSRFRRISRRLLGISISASRCSITRYDEKLNQINAVRPRSPSPDHKHIRNTQNYAPNSPVTSAHYKKRTESGSHQLWREWAAERLFRPFWRRSRSTAPTRNARGYWASERPAEAGETVSSAVNGGGKGPGNKLSLRSRA